MQQQKDKRQRAFAYNLSAKDLSSLATVKNSHFLTERYLDPPMSLLGLTILVVTPGTSETNR